MIKTTAMLLDELKDYASPKTKLARMVQRGDLIPIVRGLYETDRHTAPYLLAGSIYGPSYISFEFALSSYGMIPERVCAVTSATFEKKKKKNYQTPFGTYTYRDIPSEAFPSGIVLRREGDYWYRIAAPEKALCDQLYIMRPVKNVKELRALLFEDLRMEEDALRQLDFDVIGALAEKYHTVNTRKLCTLLRRL